MFQKYIALFSQAKETLPYHFYLSGWMHAPATAFMLLFCFTTTTQAQVKTANGFAADILNLGQTRPIISFGICFIIGILVSAFVIRRQGKRKGMAQQQMITQLDIDKQQSQALNAQLSALIEDRTVELKKSMELIQKQNEEISMLNALLRKEVIGLNLDVDKVSRTPVMSKFVDFEAFSKIYPDKDASLKYIARLKWSKGYACIRCTNETFLAGQSAYSRRCTKCGYDESATVNTIFHNSKILINKALYMLILVYDTKGTISSYKLAELLDIRQSTCWVYSSRFKKKLLESKDGFGKTEEEGWSQMVLDIPA